MFNLKKLLSIGCISLQLLLSAELVKAGTGILPYMRTKKTHYKKSEVFFLLSEDKHRRKSWTDFGGEGYVTYLCNVTCSVKKQSGKKKSLKNLKQTLAKLKRRGYDRHYTEKMAFVWVSKKDLMRTIDKDTRLGNKNVGCHQLYEFFRKILKKNRHEIANL